MIRSGIEEPRELSASSVHTVLAFSPSPSSQPPHASGPTAGPRAPEPPPGRRERRRLEVFERLLNAARNVIMNRGLERATVKDITDAADVGKGTFFLHFRSKEHVIPALIEREGAHFQRAVDRATAGESVVALLEALFNAKQTTVSLDNTMFFRSHLVAMMARDDVRELALRSLSANSERIQALLTLGQERGEIRPDFTAADLARLAQQVGMGAGLLAVWGQTDPSGDYVSASRQLVLALIRARPATAPRPVRPAPPTPGRGPALPARRRRTSGM